MKVALRTDGPARRWHERLAARLAAAGHTLVVRRVPGRGLPVGLGLTLALEQRLYKGRTALFATIGDAAKGSEADLVLEARFDGVAGERALVDALLARRAPRVEIADATGRVCAAGLPAIESPDILASGLDHVLARTEQLVAEAVRAAGEGAPSTVSDALPLQPTKPALLFLARTFASKLRAKLGAADAQLPPWRIAVRAAEAPGVALARDWRGAPFVALAHDGQRFEADPFVLMHHGRTCLFYEDFPFATRRGVIAVREQQADGHWSPSRVVLDEPFHLSYPHVFVCDGEVYMLPETSAAGRLQLYRADPFPDRFVLDRVLVDGVEANDVTIILHAGTWWLFATLSGDGSSTWDALSLYSAPHPFGPWTPHPANPVLIDAGAARPAGEMWHEGGTLMRVAQDCRVGYGAGLAICRVDRLDAEGYAQTVVERLGPPAGHAAGGVHTLNRGSSVEVIDLV